MIAHIKPTIGNEEIRAVEKILKSGYLAQGKRVAALESEFARFCGSKYAIAVNSGTAALHTALHSLSIGPGDEVITTPFTFVATANSICMTGATPVFVDIEADNFNIDPAKIEQAITKKTKAILAVNLYGKPADYEKINKIAKKYKVKVVEDAAQSVAAGYRGKKSGNLADISCFSFYATKNIMCGEGGMITTNDKNLYHNSKLFRNHGQNTNNPYSYEGIGYNYRLTDVLAVIALIQLKKVKKFTKKRQLIARTYTKAFGQMKGIIAPAISDSHVFHQYTIRITKDFYLNRDKFKEYLFKNGIDSKIYYPKPLYYFEHLKKGKRFKYPVTESSSGECLSLPIYPTLTNKEVEYIIKKIESLKIKA